MSLDFRDNSKTITPFTNYKSSKTSLIFLKEVKSLRVFGLQNGAKVFSAMLSLVFRQTARYSTASCSEPGSPGTVRGSWFAYHASPRRYSSGYSTVQSHVPRRYGSGYSTWQRCRTPENFQRKTSKKTHTQLKTFFQLPPYPHVSLTASLFE